MAGCIAVQHTKANELVWVACIQCQQLCKSTDKYRSTNQAQSTSQVIPAEYTGDTRNDEEYIHPRRLHIFPRKSRKCPSLNFSCGIYIKPNSKGISDFYQFVRIDFCVVPVNQECICRIVEMQCQNAQHQKTPQGIDLPNTFPLPQGLYCRLFQSSSSNRRISIFPI